MKANRDTIINAVAEHYLMSGDFNGTPMREIEAEDATKKQLVAALVSDGLISLNFGDRHPNPHVQALAPEAVDIQLEKLRDAGDVTHICMYPTAVHLKRIVNVDDYRDRPFTARLALGEHLFVFVPFDLRVLEQYRNDPRYWYETDDIQGRITVRSKYFESPEMKDSDQVVLKQFGFGYDDDMNRCVMAMLCDLAILSPEHQQMWRLQQIEGTYRPHPNYIESVFGHWPKRVSLFQAFIEELKTINGMAKLMDRPPMFRQEFRDRERPPKFGFLIRPTLAEMNAFVLLLDKMLSDNIDLKFFEDEVELEFREERPDGSKIARSKGSIRVLQEWLESTVRFPDPAEKDNMVSTFKRIRKLRQNPAHAINEDVFDQKYTKEQRELMIDAYTALRTLRLILGNHPKAAKYKVSRWLKEGEIWTH